MSDGVTPDVWRKSIEEIAAAARELGLRTPPGRQPFRVCAFIDETNTCVNACLTSEVLTNNTLDGEPLPDNIFWVGAINPLVAAANRATSVSCGGAWVCMHGSAGRDFPYVGSFRRLIDRGCCFGVVLMWRSSLRVSTTLWICR